MRLLSLLGFVGQPRLRSRDPGSSLHSCRPLSDTLLLSRYFSQSVVLSDPKVISSIESTTIGEQRPRDLSRKLKERGFAPVQNQAAPVSETSKSKIEGTRNLFPGSSSARVSLVQRHQDHQTSSTNELKFHFRAGEETKEPGQDDSHPIWKTSDALPKLVNISKSDLLTSSTAGAPKRFPPPAVIPSVFESLFRKPGSKRRCIESQNISLDRVKYGLPVAASRDLIVFEPFQTAKQKQRQQQNDPRQEARFLLAKDRGNMRSFASFVTVPTADTPGTTLLLHFDNRRYLIGNIGEGTQRAAIQRKSGLGKVEDIFLTGKTEWKTTGGLLGMILTLADAKTTRRLDAKNYEGYKVAPHSDPSKYPPNHNYGLTIHGSQNLTHMLATARRFVFRSGMPLEVDEYREPVPQSADTAIVPPTYQDENIKAWAMAISPSSNSRKRSHEEMSEDSSDTILPSRLGGETKLEREDREDQMRRAIVSEMFDNPWRLDKLTPIKLSEVTLPASVFIRKDGKLEKYEGPLPGGSITVPEIEVFVRQTWPGTRMSSLPPTSPSATSMSYIVKAHDARGKFDAAAAMKLGVRKGPDFRRLTSGESVTTSTGKVVTPEMVLGPSSQGNGFAILEIPDRSYIETTLARAELRSEEIMVGIGAIVWILGPGVYGDERLSQYMAENSVEHIVSSNDVCTNVPSMESATTAAIGLHMVDGQRFPIPIFSNEPTLAKPESNNIHFAQSGKEITLMPKFALFDRWIPKALITSDVINATSPEVLKLAAKARQTIESPSYLAEQGERQKTLLCPDAEITTLGTGSSSPSKYRNVSANILRIPDYGNYIFDAGENTLGQLRRVFGDELPAVLKDLKMIWISHIHADHHLGTVAVIKAWHEATRDDPKTKDNRLLVASATEMVEWLSEYASVEDYGYNRLMPLDLAWRGHRVARMHMSEYQQEAFSLIKIEAIKVRHCHESLAVALTWPNGFKVAYSGDCRPSNVFAEVARGATLLIHEATFDDEMVGDAIAKKHCTTSEALAIAEEMEARCVLLTHFSQRYQKLPVMSNADRVAIVAFDYMQCKIKDFRSAAEFRPALLKLYEQKEVDIEQAEIPTTADQARGSAKSTKSNKTMKKEARDKERAAAVKAAKVEGLQEAEDGVPARRSLSFRRLRINQELTIERIQAAVETKPQVDKSTQEEVSNEIIHQLSNSTQNEKVDLEDVRRLPLDNLLANAGYAIRDQPAISTSTLEQQLGGAGSKIDDPAPDEPILKDQAEMEPSDIHMTGTPTPRDDANAEAAEPANAEK